MRKPFVFPLLISLALLLLLQGCSKDPNACKVDTDCVKAHFTGQCTDKTCSYTPIPGECGNLLCEEDQGENTCACPADCGTCQGTVEGSQNLEQTCNENDECVVDVPQGKIKPSSSTNNLRTAGNTLSVTSTYNQPFNLKKDTFNVQILLDLLGDGVEDLRVTKLELRATDQNRQQVVLAREVMNRYLRNVNTQIDKEIQLDVTSADKESTLSNLVLEITLEYTQSGFEKTALVRNPYRNVDFIWVKPDTDYDCPDKCDDGNPGTLDVCDETTKPFCDYRPIPNACGNFVCDAGENRCNCAADCGTCQGPAGEHLEYLCSQDQCETRLKSGTFQEPQNIFDDRDLNIFHLQNNYNYNSPFNVKIDAFEIDFTLFSLKEGVSNVRITEVKLLDGSNELVSDKQPRLLPGEGASSSASLTVPDIGIPESEKALTLQVFYEYTQNEEVRKGDYKKVLGRLTFINPTLGEE